MSQVAYASAGGFAAVRSFDRQDEYRERSEQRRAEREAAKAELFRDIIEQNAFRRAFQPPHCRGLEQFEREWFEACDHAFQEAMEAAGYERRAGKSQLNAMGTTR